MKIYFHEHALKRYKERLNTIDKSNINEYNWVEIDKLRNEIKRKGKFKRDPKRKDGFYCIVGNLKVYAGFEHENTLYVITCYPYTKSFGNYFKKLDTIEYPDLKD